MAKGFLNISNFSGKSAYEIWLMNGNTGTEQEFLESLLGAAGASIISGAIVADDIVFTKDDTTTVMLTGAVTALTGPQGPQGDPGLDGAPGAAGADGADGRTILYGAASPTTEGADGDFYIDTTTHTLYGPKATTWPAGLVLKGADGQDGTNEQTNANKNKFINLLSAAADIVMKVLTRVWNGSTYIVTEVIGIGTDAVVNNTGEDCIGIGYTALESNAGFNCNGLGQYALSENTADECDGYGQWALQANHGARSNGYGGYSLSQNDGDDCNAMGFECMPRNEGIESNAFGNYAMDDNIGDCSNGFGHNTMRMNSGRSAIGFGYSAMLDNAGDDCIGIGEFALAFNNGNNNIAIGSYAHSDYVEAETGEKTVSYTAVDSPNYRITIPSHGFGATGKYVNIVYKSATGARIPGLQIGWTYQVYIVDANTIAFARAHRYSIRGVTLNGQGTGDHTFAPIVKRENTIVIGNSLMPTKNNQATIGDSSIVEFVMGGAGVMAADHINVNTAKTPASASAPGTAGDICWDANYMYVCVATDTWKRTAISTWV